MVKTSKFTLKLQNKFLTCETHMQSYLFKSLRWFTWYSDIQSTACRLGSEYQVKRPQDGNEPTAVLKQLK